MGKCQSCCETPGTSSATRYSTGHTSADFRARAYHQPVGKDIRTDANTGDVIQMASTRPGLSSEKKMFTPYPKLPPIKKHSNGESKRLSFISRDVSETKIQALFDQYKDAEEDAILVEGIESFCRDLDVNPDDFVVLVLAWKFQAETMGRFSRQEFLNGCKSLKADSIKGIQSKFPELLNEVKTSRRSKICIDGLTSLD
ncbi:hypothetical protein FSP39_015323 [Pinctada imbricata]|uniref:Defective in cullin neddylation protein n=1 Tax=Pinctada imbricata TaxID=66713 RepID=A0AA89BR15_PINIB|nr:hypothetical protein FSP39_015323 [Pinctada imbricata]